MSPTENLIDKINKVLSGQKVYGVSNTNLNNTNFGSLQGIMDLVKKTMPVREPIDPALISLMGFAKMGEEASKPGATALGAGFSGISTAAQTYLADQLARQKEESDATKTGLTLGATLLKPKTTTMKGSGDPTLVKYMKKTDAVQFLKNKGLSSEAPTFGYLVGQLTAPNEEMIGKPIRQDGKPMGFQLVTKGGIVVDGALTIFKGGGQSLDFTSRQDKLKIINKLQNTQNSQLTNLIPTINSVLPVLLNPEVETGFWQGKFLDVRKALSGIFQIDDEDLDDMQFLEATSSKLAPMMRPAGSGSTSDMEFSAYRKASLDIGSSKYANYLNLYVLREMTKNGIALNMKEKELLLNEEMPQSVINQRLLKADTGIFKKFQTHRINENQEYERIYENDEEEEKAFYKFYDKLKIGDVMLNQNSKMQPLDKNRNTYLIKLPPKDGNRNMADL